MGELLIACGMLRDELELAMARTGRAPETVWLDKGLHDSPGILRAAVQEEIDRREGTCRLILLGMAYCGGALDGVGSRTAAVAVPRFDDCVRLLLALEPENRHLGDSRSLYFTRQWMISDRYIVREMERYRRIYGEKRPQKSSGLCCPGTAGCGWWTPGDTTWRPARGPLSRMRRRLDWRTAASRVPYGRWKNCCCMSSTENFALPRRESG